MTPRSTRRRPTTTQRLAALAAMVLTAVAVGLVVAIVIDEFPRGLIVLGLIALALTSCWFGLLRRGLARVLGLGLAALALAAAAFFLFTQGDHGVQATILLASLLLGTGAAREAFRLKVPLPPARRPRHAVLLYNPRSGGGKVERFELGREARDRDIEPIELT